MLLPCSERTITALTICRTSAAFNRFRKFGLIDPMGCIQAHKPLLNVILLDQVLEHNCQKPAIGVLA